MTIVREIEGRELPKASGYDEHMFLREFQCVPDFGASCSPRIREVAQQIAAYVAIVMLWYSSTNLFALGMIAGVVANEQCYVAKEKLKHLVTKSSLATVSILLLVTFPAFILIHLSCVFLAGTITGNHFYRRLDFS